MDGGPHDRSRHRGRYAETLALRLPHENHRDTTTEHQAPGDPHGRRSAVAGVRKTIVPGTKRATIRESHGETPRDQNAASDDADDARANPHLRTPSSERPILDGITKELVGPRDGLILRV